MGALSRPATEIRGGVTCAVLTRGSSASSRPAIEGFRILTLQAAVLLLLACLLLPACTIVPKAPPAGMSSAPWPERRALLQSRERFELTGRIAVAAAQEGFNAKLRWQQQGTRSHLALDGPLGLGGVQITSEGTTLNVVTSKGEHLNNEAAHREVATKLGFEPPLESLRYWVLGVPDPSHPADEVLDANQRLATLRQDGWQVDYTTYSAAGGQWLPTRLTLTRDDVRVKLLVDGWGP
ncbi:MAG: lipoprotein insertase outer membrane protein LolB [Gammaproteobacteria bacterium]